MAKTAQGLVLCFSLLLAAPASAALPEPPVLSASERLWAQAEEDELAEDWAGLRTHLDAYRKAVPADTDPERRFLTEAWRGLLAWRASCPVADETGLCIEITRPDLSFEAVQRWRSGQRSMRPPPLKTCTIYRPIIQVRARRPERVREALAHFQRAQALARALPAPETLPDGPAAETQRQQLRLRERALAAIRLSLGDQMHEAVLAPQLPPRIFVSHPHVPGGPKEPKFKAWLALQYQQIEKAQRQYATVRELKDPAWLLASMARRGQLLAGFASRLMRSDPQPPPPTPRGREPEDFARTFNYYFCDNMTDLGEAFERRATELFTQCLVTAAAQSVSDAWTRLCERELSRLRPHADPIDAEIRPQPGYAAPVTDVAPVGTAPSPPAAN